MGLLGRGQKWKYWLRRPPWEYTHGNRAGRGLDRWARAPQATDRLRLLSRFDPTRHPDLASTARGRRGQVRAVQPVGLPRAAQDGVLLGENWSLAPHVGVGPRPAWKKQVWSSWLLVLAAPLPAQASSIWNSNGKIRPGTGALGLAVCGCLGA